jgi:hypothetical protein
MEHSTAISTSRPPAGTVTAVARVAISVSLAEVLSTVLVIEVNPNLIAEVVNARAGMQLLVVIDRPEPSRRLASLLPSKFHLVAEGCSPNTTDQEV